MWVIACSLLLFLLRRVMSRARCHNTFSLIPLLLSLCCLCHLSLFACLLWRMARAGTKNRRSLQWRLEPLCFFPGRSVFVGAAAPCRWVCFVGWLGWMGGMRGGEAGSVWLLHLVGGGDQNGRAYGRYGGFWPSQSGNGSLNKRPNDVTYTFM